MRQIVKPNVNYHLIVDFGWFPHSESSGYWGGAVLGQVRGGSLVISSVTIPLAGTKKEAEKKARAIARATGASRGLGLPPHH